MLIPERFAELIKPYTPDLLSDGAYPTGCFLGMPEGIYHSLQAFSYSGAKELKKSPAHFQAYLQKEWSIDPEREKYKAVHLLCLEPEEQTRIIIRDGVWGGALKAEVQGLQKQGYIVLKSKDYAEAKDIAASISSHGLAGALIAQSLGEVTLLWHETINGAPVRCKARVDILSLKEAAVLLYDLKNFGSIAEQKDINRQIEKQRYPLQLSWYRWAVYAVLKTTVDRSGWIFVEDSRPHGVKPVSCPTLVMTEGSQELRELLKLYEICTRNNQWPSYEEEESEYQPYKPGSAS